MGARAARGAARARARTAERARAAARARARASGDTDLYCPLRNKVGTYGPVGGAELPNVQL